MYNKYTNIYYWKKSQRESWWGSLIVVPPDMPFHCYTYSACYIHSALLQFVRLSYFIPKVLRRNIWKQTRRWACLSLIWHGHTNRRDREITLYENKYKPFHLILFFTIGGIEIGIKMGDPHFQVF